MINPVIEIKDNNKIRLAYIVKTRVASPTTLKFGVIFVCYFQRQ